MAGAPEVLAPRLGRSRTYGDYQERKTNLSAAIRRCREAAAEGDEPAYQVTLEDVGRLALDRREEGAVRELRRRRNAASKDPALTKSGQRAASAAIDRELTAKLEELEGKTEAECRDAGLVRCAELVLAKTERKKGDREAALRVLRESGATYDEIGLAWSRAKGKGPRDMRFRNGRLTPFGEQLDRLWRLSGAGWRDAGGAD